MHGTEQVKEKQNDSQISLCNKRYMETIDETTETKGEHQR